MFRDCSCFFREKFPESCRLLSTILPRYIRHWLGKASLEFIGTRSGGWTRYFLHLSNDFIGKNRRNVLEVTKMMSYEKFNLYLNFISKFKGSSRHQHF